MTISNIILEATAFPLKMLETTKINMPLFLTLDFRIF